MANNIKELQNERMYLLWKQKGVDEGRQVQGLWEEVSILQKIGLYFEECRPRKPKDLHDAAYTCLWSVFSVTNIANRINETPLDVYEALVTGGHVFHTRGHAETAVVKSLEFIDYERRLLFMGTDAKWAKVLGSR